MKTIQKLKIQDRAMTLRAAIAYARGSEYDRAVWLQAEKTIVAAGLCPSCIQQDNSRSRLGPWEPGNQWEYAGKRCPNCEDFFPCGEQPEYEPDPWNGDADPGL